MESKRKDEEYKLKEQQKNLEIMRRLRENEEYKEKERHQNHEIVKRLREQPEFKEKEREQNLEIMKKLREQPEYKEKEREQNLEIMKKLREQPEYKEKEREQNLEIMKKLREQLEYKEKEKEQNIEIMKRLREHPEYKEKEKKQNREITKRLRENLDYRDNERKRDSQIKKSLRENPEYNEKEREQNLKVMKRLREDPKHNEKERERNLEIMKRLREHPEYKEKEKKQNREITKRLRENLDYRDNERKQDSQIKKRLRENPEYNEKEREQNLKVMRRLREDPKYNEKEREQNLKIMKGLREDPEYIEKEREQNLEIMKKLRQSHDYQEQEREKNRLRLSLKRQSQMSNKSELEYNNEYKRKMRSNEILKFRENFIKLLRSENSLLGNLKLDFIEVRGNMPTFVCCSCEGLFFEHSVIRKKFDKIIDKDFVLQVYNYSSEYICKTCQNYVSKKRIPKLCTSNGLKFIDIPPCIKNLSDLEERMVAPYINFMQVKALKSFTLNPQLGIKGSVINIPVDLDDMLRVLPRKFDDMATIQLKLRRHVEHKTHYMFETIRPGIICQALSYLVKTPLYMKHKITVDGNFFLQFDSNFDEKINFIVDSIDDTEPLKKSQECVKKTCEKKDDDDNSEAESDIDMDEEVMLIDQNRDITNSIQVIAPGQNKNPVPWHFMEDIDELCFPRIFGGYPLEIPKTLSYNDRVISECRRRDRRSCIPQRIFFMAKKKLEKTVLANINV